MFIEIDLIEIDCFAEDSAERADQAENQLGKLRAKSRSSVSVSRISPGVSLSRMKYFENESHPLVLF